MHANPSCASMSTEAYRLPDLLALLPEKPGGEINPHFKEVEATFNAWMRKTLGGPRAVEVSRSESPLIIAMVFPLASQYQLKGIIDYYAASFLLDDLLYVSFHRSFRMYSGNLHSDRSPSEDVRALSQLWMKTLRDGNEGKSVQHPLIEMMRSELLVSIRPVVSSVHWPQFVTENEMMVNDMVQETHEREVYQNMNATPDIQSYMMKRRFTIGTGPSFVLLRSTRCLYIPDDVLANPVVLEMQNTTTEMLLIENVSENSLTPLTLLKFNLCFIQDIYSFKKEYAFDGAFVNLLTVMQNDPETAHLDFQGRLDYAEKLFKAALERFQACRQELPSFGPEMDQYLALYTDGLIDMVIGNLQWSLVNGRYNTFTSDEDRRNNVMRLALDGFPAHENDVSVR
ncbi:isoprenoid synthase domain-containing protein [Lanmaoa asiatica]|nr:isoprenoid synthase domain-containing protein [Lanmaoa asiatica]